MKIRPVILCGGSGTRLWSDQKHHQPKQFIDFGNWTLFGKTLERIKNSIFDYPIISTNKKYVSEIKKYLRLKGFKKFRIILEPAKRNTAPAILSSVLIKEIQVGLILGILYGFLLGLFANYNFIQANPFLGVVVGLSICCSMIIAAAVGAFTPLILRKLDIDPAIATGPFVTTSVDILGVLLYFIIAGKFLNM